MKDRKLNVTSGWIDTYDQRRLYKYGYSVGGYTDKGVSKYVLYRDEGVGKYTPIHEFQSAEELNNMIKLLIPPGEE